MKETLILRVCIAYSLNLIISSSSMEIGLAYLVLINLLKTINRGS